MTSQFLRERRLPSKRENLEIAETLKEDDSAVEDISLHRQSKRIRKKISSLKKKLKMKIFVVRKIAKKNLEKINKKIL